MHKQKSSSERASVSGLGGAGPAAQRQRTSARPSLSPESERPPPSQADLHQIQFSQSVHADATTDREGQLSSQDTQFSDAELTARSPLEI